jgi:hypothetical protein
LKKISKKIEKEYKKKSREIINYIFKSIYSLTGLEFDSLTENDLKNAKFIHWPSFAKRNELVYKKFEEEKTIKIILAVDPIIFYNIDYYEFFLVLRHELLKLPDVIKKELLFLNKGKIVSLKNNTTLYNYLRSENKEDIVYSSFVKAKNSVFIVLSDFLREYWDFDKLKKIIANQYNNDYLFLFLRPKYNFYFPFELFLIYKLRRKVEKRFNDFKFKNKILI